MKSFYNTILSFASVHHSTYYISEARSKKLITALACFIPISGFLAGYAMYVNVDYLIPSTFISVIIGVMVGYVMIAHDQSILSTDKTFQIWLKVFLSLALAVTFTVTNSAKKDQEVLVAELESVVSKRNVSVSEKLHEELEKIEAEERELGLRAEETAKNTLNKQPFYDARRNQKNFAKTKNARIERIKNLYSGKQEVASISQMDVLVLQAKKMANGGADTFVSIILAFLFFILESLPVILRLLLSDSDYIIRHHADLIFVRKLRDQSINCRHTFISPDGDIITELFNLDLIEEKRKLILSNFEDKDLMRKLAYRRRLLQEDFDPYTGRPLNEIDFEFLFGNHAQTENKADQEEPKSFNEDDKKEEPQEAPIFDI